MSQQHFSTKASADFRISWRIKYHLWENDTPFESLLALLDSAPEGFDELMFFAGEYVFHHGYWPMDELAERFELLKKRMEPVRDRGIRCTVNILSTHGAECYGLPDDVPRLPYDGSVHHDGKTSKKVASPADERYLEWSAELHRLAAATGGEDLWVDDHICSPVRGSGDFSGASLRGFEGGKWSREDLVKALNDPENDDLRHRWLSYQTEVLANYCRVVGQAARREKPDVRMGLMTVGFTNVKHQGDFYIRCFEAMKAECARPGHGFYRDDDPPGMLKKQMEVSAQVARYPEHVEEVLYEFEDWPSCRLFKGLQTIDNEVTGAIMNGCTGVAMSYLHPFSQDLSEYTDAAQRLGRRKGFWQKLVETCRDLPQAGVLNVQAPNYAENVRSGKTPWIEINKKYDAVVAWRWLALGIPLTGDKTGAPAAVLTGQAAEGLSRAELEDLLKGGLLLDEGALRACWNHGLGELTGVKPREYTEALYETFTDHPINEGFVGDGRSPVWWGGVPVDPLNDEVEVLSRLLRFDHKVDFGASTTLYQNELGGRIVHLGLDAWFYMGTTHKIAQLRRLVDWASAGRFPLEILGGYQIAPTLRQSADGSRFVLGLQNSGFDPIENLRLRLRTTARAAADLEDGSSVAMNRLDENMVEITAPPIGPWQHCVIHSVE